MIAAAAMVAMAGAAQAALVSLGDGTVKDTTNKLIWLEDWNVNGSQDFATQQAWAAGLNFAGRSDWVLPNISDYTSLFAQLGDLNQVSEFTNVQAGRYWSDNLRAFRPDNGDVNPAGAGALFSAVAVRSGNVTVAVPEPQSLALALLALSAMGVARRRRSR